MAPRSFGNSRTTSSLRDGIHAQMTPTWASTVDHTPTSKKSQVGFVVSGPNLTSDRSRRILTTVTLYRAGQRIKQSTLSAILMETSTHKVPTQNIMATPIFFLQSSLRLLNCHRGIASIQTSKAMLTAALDQAIALLFRHLPRWLPSHFNQ